MTPIPEREALPEEFGALGRLITEHHPLGNEISNLHRLQELRRREFTETRMPLIHGNWRGEIEVRGGVCFSGSESGFAPHTPQRVKDFSDYGMWNLWGFSGANYCEKDMTVTLVTFGGVSLKLFVGETPFGSGMFPSSGGDTFSWPTISALEALMVLPKQYLNEVGSRGILSVNHCALGNDGNWPCVTLVLPVRKIEGQLLGGKEDVLIPLSFSSGKLRKDRAMAIQALTELSKGDKPLAVVWLDKYLKVGWDLLTA